jgi:hypothetical protein
LIKKKHGLRFKVRLEIREILEEVQLRVDMTSPDYYEYLRSLKYRVIATPELEVSEEKVSLKKEYEIQVDKEKSRTLYYIYVDSETGEPIEDLYKKQSIEFVIPAGTTLTLK